MWKEGPVERRCDIEVRERHGSQPRLLDSMGQAVEVLPIGVQKENLHLSALFWLVSHGSRALSPTRPCPLAALTTPKFTAPARGAGREPPKNSTLGYFVAHFIRHRSNARAKGLP